jgi:hypothetical protein
MESNFVIDAPSGYRFVSFIGPTITTLLVGKNFPDTDVLFESIEDVANVTHRYDKRLTELSGILAQIQQAIADKAPVPSGCKRLLPVVWFNNINW